MGSVRAPVILFCWRQQVNGIIGLESLKMVGLEINTSKTEYMHINENNFPTQISASVYDDACHARGTHESQHPNSTNATINLLNRRICMTNLPHRV